MQHTKSPTTGTHFDLLLHNESNPFIDELLCTLFSHPQVVTSHITQTGTGRHKGGGGGQEQIDGVTKLPW